MNTGEFERGVARFNAQEFFTAHEVWEEIWLRTAAPEKTLLQGLIQIAAAFHHYGLGNVRGAKSLAAAGIGKLSKSPDGYRGIDVVRLVSETQAWIDALTEDRQAELQPPEIHQVG